MTAERDALLSALSALDHLAEVEGALLKSRIQVANLEAQLVRHPTNPDREAVGRIAPNKSFEQRFTNEIGNEILVAVASGREGGFCKICLYGPDSAIESYTTFMEAEKLHEGLSALFPTSGEWRPIDATPAQIKAGMPWLSAWDHMRKTDKEQALNEAFKAMQRAGRAALSGEG